MVEFYANHFTSVMTLLKPQRLDSEIKTLNLRSFSNLSRIEMVRRG